MTYNQQITGFVSALDLLGQITSAATALSAIEGKRMGAAQAGDKEGLNMQTSDYQDTLNQMVINASSLSNLMTRATAELEAVIEVQSIREQINSGGANLKTIVDPLLKSVSIIQSEKIEPFGK